MNGKLIGYGRVGLFGPPLKEQLDALQAEDCWNIYADRRRNLRWPRLELALMDLRPGDAFVVYSGLCFGHMQAFVDVLGRVAQAAASFRSIAERLDIPDGMLPETAGFLSVAMNAMRSARSEAIQEGLAAARAAGRIGGRRPVLSAEKRAAVMEMIAGRRRSMAAIAKELGVARSSLYNAGLSTDKKEKPPTRSGSGSVAE